MVRILVRWIMTSETVELFEVEEAAEHVALDLRDAALLVQEVDRPRSSSVAERIGWFSPMSSAEGRSMQPHEAPRWPW